jgi:hypothetical protein
MKFSSAIKKGAVIGALSLGLTAFAAVPANPAFAAANTDPQAQKLVDALKALNINQVDYLYAYLQSVNLSDSEYNQILDNTKAVSKILNGTSADKLANAQKVEVLRLFLDSVKLSHLQASFVDAKGNPIDILNYKAGASTLLVQLKDLKGNVLASLNPTKADLDPKVLQTKINALDSAVKAKKQLEKTGKFVPMPSGDLPNTSTNEPGYIALGGLLMLMGGLAVIPAARLVRKPKALQEA